MKRWYSLLGPASVALCLGCTPALAGDMECAHDASSTRDARFGPELAFDGDWISRWQARDEREGAWVRVRFSYPRHVGAVVIVDQANQRGLITAVRLGFSDGDFIDYRLPVSQDPTLPQNGLLWQPIDSGPTPRPDKGAHFIRFAPRRTEWVRVTILEMDETPGNASLAEVRVISVPEDEAQPLASQEQMDQAQRSSYALRTELPAEPWILSNDELSVTVSNQTGLISRLTSLQPTPADVTSGSDAGAVLYVRNIERGWRDTFSELKAWYLGSGREEGQGYTELICVVAPAEYPVAFCQVRYRLFSDRLEQRIRFHYLVDDWCRYRFGWYNPFSPEDWPEHRDTGFAFEPSATRWVKLYSHAYDICWEQGDWGTLVFPLGALRRADRYLLYGSLDLGPHLVLGPNVEAENTVPSVFVMPMGLRKGDTYTFDLFIKAFPRERNEYLEALNWYCRRTHWEHPELQGTPVRLTQKVSRVLSPGKFVGAPFPGFRGDTPEKLAEMKQWMRNTGATNLAYAGWDGWVHPPDELEGAEWSGYMGELSTGKLRDDIASLKAEGFRPFLYINNFARPPWVAHENEGGRLIDTGNALEREWYVKRVQEAVRLMEPSGLFWDCGWWPLHYCAPNNAVSADARGDVLKGWLLIQARVYHWLKANYPDMQVCMNLMSGGSPSQFFTDAIMIEGEGIASPQLMEDSKALMTNVVSYFSVFYYDIFPPVLKEHSLEFAQTIDAGLPDEVRADLWDRYMARGLKSVGMGGSLGGDPNTLVEHTPERRRAFPEYNGYAFYFPISRETIELDRFCALANATPMAPSSFAVVTGSPSVLGSAWAATTRLMVSLYNDGPGPEDVSAVVDLELLREYGLEDHGELMVEIVGRDGVLLPERALLVHDDGGRLRLEGRLESRELALIQSR